MDEYRYKDLFQRNIGLFTDKQQERISKLKIAIAGAGGLGGPVAYTLARLGVGEIRLIDPDKFDVSNINRQYGAYIDTIGDYKAESICKELGRINPFLELKFYNTYLGKDNVEEFLREADVVIDCIDFFQIEAEIILHNEARKSNLWILTSQAAGEIQSFTNFDPSKKPLEDYLYNKDNPAILEAIKFFFPVLPRVATPELINDLIEGKIDHVSSHATPPPIGGSIVAEQMIKILIKKEGLIFRAPDMYIFNLDTYESKLYKR